MAIQKRVFGTCKQGQTADLYTLENSNGMQAQITNFGGALVSLLVNDQDGRKRDVVMGYDNLSSYEDNPPYCGALIGRCSNRISGGQFSLDGQDYIVALNNGANHLHGGPDGFDQRLWQAEQTAENSLKLTLFSHDMDQGYPGNLIACVVYTVTDDNALDIAYQGFSDRRTLFNMTNHAYFNLGGQTEPTILDHDLLIRASRITLIDENLSIPGELEDVTGTPFDFRTTKKIGRDIGARHDQLLFAKGYDHNFVLEKTDQAAAEVFCETTGIQMAVMTDLPGIQLYTGNFLDDTVICKGGMTAQPNRALCLETQFFPDAINHPHFNQPIIEAGQLMSYTTRYAFSIKSN